MTEQKRLRAETDRILTELSHELPPHIMRRLDRALAAERAHADAEIATLRSELEQVKRERDEARAEVERLRDRLQTAVDEQVSPHETLPAEELITLLEHSLAEGRHERERLRGALEEALQMLEGQSQRPSRIARIRAALREEAPMRDHVRRLRCTWERDAEARDTQRTEGERRRNLTLVWWRDRVIPRGQVFRLSRRACPECGREAPCAES